MMWILHIVSAQGFLFARILLQIELRGMPDMRLAHGRSLD